MIVENIDATQADATLFLRHGIALVGLDGRSLDAAGVLRGGVSGDRGAASLLHRNEPLRISRFKSTLQSELETREFARDAAQTRLQDLREGFEKATREAQQAELAATSHARDAHQLSRALREAESQQASLESQLEEAREIGTSAAAEREKIESEIQGIISSRSELEGRIKEEEARLHVKEQQSREKDSELQGVRVEEASLRERSQSLKRETETARRLISDRERRISEITRTLEKAKQEREQFSGGESGLEVHIKALTAEVATARDAHAQVRDRIEQSNAKVNEAIEHIKTFHHQGDSKTAAANQVALDLEKISSDLSHLVQNLEEKYGPGCLERPVTSHIQEEMSEPIITAEMSADEEILLGEEVERLRERIRRLAISIPTR